MNTTVVRTSSQNVANTTSTGRYVRAGLVGGVAAAALNSGIAVVVKAFDVKLEAQGKGFPALAFAQVTLFATIVGIGLAAILVRRARRPRHAFVVTTVVLTVVSLVPPLLIGATAATVAVLEVMHVLAGLVVIPAMASRLPE